MTLFTFSFTVCTPFIIKSLPLDPNPPVAPVPPCFLKPGVPIPVTIAPLNIDAAIE